MILTTDINISNTNLTAKIAPKNQSFPKTVVGPSANESPNEAVYTLTDYDYKSNKVTIANPTPQEMVDFDADKDNVQWAFWIDGGLMDTGYVVISNRSLQPESETDITLTTDGQILKDNLSSKGYLEATVETVIENGDVVNKLTIKFSKWLDGKNVYDEPFRKKPDHIETKDYVQTTAITAPIEIVDAYWVNQQQNRITSTAYNTEISLVIISLGLTNTQVTLQLFDDDSSEDTVDDLILWNNGGPSNELSRDINIAGRETIMPYQVEGEGSSLYAAANEPITEIEGLELYLQISAQPGRFAEIILTSSAKVNRLFFATKSVDDSYSPISSVYPGMSAYLVAETTGLNGLSAQFSILAQDNILVSSGTKLPLIEAGIEKTDFTATVINDFASVQVTFQEIGSTTYDSWLASLIPTSGGIQESLFAISATVNSINYNSTDDFKILAPIVTQNIYYDGTISKENYVENIIRKVRFEYHNTSLNSPFDFGIFDLEWVQKWIYPGTTFQPSGKLGDDYVKHFKKISEEGKKVYAYYRRESNIKTPIVRIFNVQIAGNTRYKFEATVDGTLIRLSEDTGREYFNPERIAALIGALIDCGHDDVVTNGSVQFDESKTGEDEISGTGSPSLTHVNGNNIDFKYMRIDSQRPRIDISEGVILSNSTLLDEERQNEFLDSAYKFGFGRIPDSNGRLNLSHYLSDGVTLLNHCNKASGHQDHLHLQGFEANYKTS